MKSITDALELRLLALVYQYIVIHAATLFRLKHAQFNRTFPCFIKLMITIWHGSIFSSWPYVGRIHSQSVYLSYKRSIIRILNYFYIVSFNMPLNRPWASYQIRKTAGCACAGNAGNVFPRRRFKRKPLVSDPGMHHGTRVTHVPWCMPGSLTCGHGENVPGIPDACAPAILRIWQEAHC